MIDVEPSPLPDGYVCPEGTVPGWLNVDGLPTSCVGDLPMVEPMPEREVSDLVVPPMPPAPFEDGELIPPVTVYPSPLPLDIGPDVLAATGLAFHPLVLFAVAFALLALMLAFLAAYSFAKSPVKPRYKRRGVDASPEEAAAFPNLLGKGGA